MELVRITHSSSVRTIARALGSCVPGTADLQSEIVAILQENNEELRADNVADIDCLLIETLLSYCHEKNENTVIGTYEGLLRRPDGSKPVERPLAELSDDNWREQPRILNP